MYQGAVQHEETCKMWGSSGETESGHKGYVGEHTYTEETSVDREMKGDGINKKREHHRL